MERLAEPGRMTPQSLQQGTRAPDAAATQGVRGAASACVEWDLARDGASNGASDGASNRVRALNQWLHHDAVREGISAVRVLNPDGRHQIAAGLNAPLSVEIAGHAGYFVAGMNQLAEVTVQGNVGWSVAENMMSGTVRVKGCASESAGASGHGGLLVIEGDASSRCGISLKGLDIVVGGSVGHMSGFMAQAGTLVVCGDAAHGLGDSLYEAVIYVRGTIDGLGTDARQEALTAADIEKLSSLLARAGLRHDPQSFKRIASARSLYHWHIDSSHAY
jgi:methylamine---glutamate N-methyltransferase subunit B